MKFFILGLDGLDYNLVEKWNLPNLKQNVYSKIDVPINKERGVPTTPEVWGSFLAGKRMSDLEFDRVGPVGKIVKIIIRLRKHINLSLGIGRLFGYKAPRTFPKLGTSTFIDRPDISEINAPFYSYDHTVFRIIHKFGNDKISMQQTVNELIEFYEAQKERIIRETKKKLSLSRVIFAYIHFPDAFQHFLFTRPHLIKEHYVDLDNYVLRLKKTVRDVLFIIVSDHGFDLKNGTHSIYGFYSSSKILNPEPKRITDFYKIILE